MALKLLEPDHHLASKFGIVTVDQKPIEQVLHNARYWLELHDVALKAVNRTRVMTVQPVEDAHITECMLTLRHLP